MTTSTIEAELGDRLPTALASYYDALDDGRLDDVAAAFAPDVVYAGPPTEGIETDPRSVSNGRDEVRERVRARGAKPWRHDVLLCTVEGPDAVVEGLTRETSTGAARSSFAAAVHVDADGLISRYVAFQCVPEIRPLPADANPSDASPGIAIDKVHEYFRALDDSRFDDAAACFSPDTLYSHPPYKDPKIGGPGRAAFSGRDELAAAFHRRGTQQIDHRIVFSAQRGPHLLLEGIVNDAAGALMGTFVSSLTLDGAGLIRRYASWYTQPGIPRR